MNLAAIQSHLLQQLPELLGLYLFGSQASGHGNSESDTDLAVLVEGYVPPLTLWTLAGELADITGTPVDLLDLRNASTVMQHQVIQHGQRVWARDSKAALYESFILSEKTNLDAARAGLLGDVYQQGAIYGR